MQPGFCRRCRTCAEPGHARTFVGRGFGACDQHAWLAFVYVCLSLWKNGFVVLARGTLRLLWVLLSVYLLFGAFLALIFLGLNASLAIPFGVSGLAALCIVPLLLARRLRRLDHITCGSSSANEPSAMSGMSHLAVSHRGAASHRWQWRWG